MLLHVIATGDESLVALSETVAKELPPGQVLKVNLHRSQPSPNFANIFGSATCLIMAMEPLHGNAPPLVVHAIGLVADGPCQRGRKAFLISRKAGHSLEIEDSGTPWVAQVLQRLGFDVWIVATQEEALSVPHL